MVTEALFLKCGLFARTTGVDYNHPALGGGFGDGYKIRLGYNLVDPTKDDQEAGTHRPPEDPYDVCKGEDGSK